MGFDCTSVAMSTNAHIPDKCICNENSFWVYDSVRHVQLNVLLIFVQESKIGETNKKNYFFNKKKPNFISCGFISRMPTLYVRFCFLQLILQKNSLLLDTGLISLYVHNIEEADK